MATRSTLTIHHQQDGQTVPAVHLYRHWDGGLWGNGPSLSRILRGLDPSSDPATVSAALLASGDGYELTEDAEMHGDREHHFDIFTGTAGFMLRHGECSWRDEGKLLRWRFCGTLQQFRDYVAHFLRHEYRPAFHRARERAAKPGAYHPIQVGRRVHCILYGGKDGIIYQVHGTPAPETVRNGPVSVSGGRASVDIVWENGSRSLRASESLLTSVQWRLYSDKCGIASGAEIKAALAFADQEEARKKREKEEADAKFRAECERLGEAHPELTPGEPAKNLRAELKAAFPGVKFSVRQPRGCDSVRIAWEGGPDWEAVHNLAGKYQLGSFDGMTDSYDYRRSPWTTVFGGWEYVSCERNRMIGRNA